MNNKKIKFRLIATMLTLVMSISLTTPVFAVTQAEIDAMKANRDAISAQKDTLQSSYNSLSSSKEDELAKLAIINEKIDLVTSQINSTQAELDVLNGLISETQEDLMYNHMEQEAYYELYFARVRSLEEDGSIDYWKVLFSAESFSDLVDRLNMIGEIITYDNRILTKLKNLIEENKQILTTLESQEDAANATMAELEEYSAEYATEAANAQAIIDSLQSQMSDLSDEMYDLESQKAALNNSISTAEAALKAAQEAAQAAQNSATQGIEAQKPSTPATPNTTTTDNSSDSSSSSESSDNSSTKEPEPAPAPPPSNSSIGTQIANYALQYVGCDYVYGGSGPYVFDCSGLVMYVYRQFGYSLGHGVLSQFASGTRIDKSQLIPGDLVFFHNNWRGPAHVGIYIGGGQFVHASDYGIGVIVSSMNTSYYIREYSGATRIAW